MQPLTIDEEKYIKGWSWGGFFGSWIFLFINKQTKLASKILFLFFVVNFVRYAPWMNIISIQSANEYGNALNLVYFGLSIWIGLKGREMVWNSGIYTSIADFQLKQKLVSKLNVVFIISMMVVSTMLTLSFAKPYINNPELLDQKIMQGAFEEARSNNLNLDEGEFNTGYTQGMTDGKNTATSSSFISDKTTAYQSGYRYGYMVSCMKVTNNQSVCAEKVITK